MVANQGDPGRHFDPLHWCLGCVLELFVRHMIRASLRLGVLPPVRQFRIADRRRACQVGMIAPQCSEVAATCERIAAAMQAQHPGRDVVDQTLAAAELGPVCQVRTTVVLSPNEVPPLAKPAESLIRCHLKTLCSDSVSQEAIETGPFLTEVGFTLANECCDSPTGGNCPVGWRFGYGQVGRSGPRDHQTFRHQLFAGLQVTWHLASDRFWCHPDEATLTAGSSEQSFGYFTPQPVCAFGQADPLFSHKPTLRETVRRHRVLGRSSILGT